jgi:hypothetical protein
MKCKNKSFHITIKIIVGSGNGIIKVVMNKKKTVVRIITTFELVKSDLVRFHCIRKILKFPRR